MHKFRPFRSQLSVVLLTEATESLETASVPLSRLKSCDGEAGCNYLTATQATREVVWWCGGVCVRACKRAR